MSVRLLLCATAYVLISTTSADAIERMNPTVLERAIVYGNSATMVDLVTAPEWNRAPEADNPWRPTFRIQTPFLMAAAAESLANKTYKPLTQSLIHELKTNNEVTFSATLTSEALGGNDNATCVIKQYGHVMQPTKETISGRDVVEIGDDAAYRRTLQCSFSLNTFDYLSPFTFVLANIDFAYEVGQERDYDLDPSTFR
jgi:hypothetical protein